MILGIETSCDETSVALLERDGTVRVNLIASQIDRHQPFGGVVPEIASREHLQHLFLLVSVAGAQGLSYALGVPLLSINHLEGHLFSPYLQREGAAASLPARFLSM